jgi:hypothetical protein
MTSSEPARRRALLQVLALGIAPALALGPTLAAGERFLPWLPAGLEPLRSEHEAEARAAFEGANFAQSDRIFPVLTDQLAMREELGGGALPTWEPHLGLGVPLFAGSIAAPAYPPNALAFLLPPEVAAGPLALLTLFLAGAGMLLFLRRIELGLPAALLGAFGYQLGGFAVGNLFYPMKVDAALWLPWCLWGVEGLARKARWSGLALTLATTLSFLAGFVPIAAFVLALTALHALGRALALRGLGIFLRATLFLALGVAGAALQLLPTAEASRASLRQSQSVEDLASQALPVTSVLGTVVRDLAGSPASAALPGHLPIAWWMTPADQWQRAEHANALEWNTYAGALVALLALVALVARPRQAAWPTLAMALVLGFAQAWTPLRWLFRLPGLDLGAPPRVLGLAWCLWPWLAALGLAALLERSRRALLALGLGSAALGISALAVRATLDERTFPARLEDLLLERYGERFHQTLDEVRARVDPQHSAEEAVRLRAELALCAWACAVGLAAALLAHVRPRPAAGLLVLGSLAELAWSSHDHLQGRGAAAGEPFPDSQAIEAVRRACGDGRVLRYDPSASGVDDVVDLARPNLLAAYGIGDLTPYTVFTPRTLIELVLCVDPRARYRSGLSRLSDPALLSHPVLDLLRVTCVLSREPLEHPRLEPVLVRERFCVYHRTRALPSARIVPTAIVGTSDEAVLANLQGGFADFARSTLLAPHGALPSAPPPGVDWQSGTIESCTRPSRARLRLSVRGSSGGWLVVHEQHAAGWRARVNGDATPLFRADHVYRALRLPAGDSQVELEYAPPSLALGAWLSAASLVLAFLVAWRARR